jgi:glycosyltransferase involved in cell wall biosynthesis
MSTRGEKASGITVVIPCLNEEESIGAAVDAAREGISATGLPGEVVVVNNGSSDRSEEIARKHGARVIHEHEKGYGAALRKGFANARHDVIVMGDGDCTYDFTKLGDLVEPILAGEADFVVGNRMRNLEPGSMPWLHRHVGNPALSLMLRCMFRSNSVKDAHCGMRAISKESYRSLGCVTTGMEFASEMVIRAIHRKLSIQERDIIYHPRAGESKLKSFRDGWRHLRFMLLHSPSWTLIIPGVFTWTFGMVIVLPATFGEIIIYGHALSIHSIIAGGILNIISMQLITMGLIGKAYAHFTGLREDPVILWLYSRLTFERLILYTLPLILFGLFLTLKVVFEWVADGFGPIDEAKVLFLGMLLLINGTQIWAAGYLFSIIALPRHIGPFEIEDISSGTDG